MDSSGIRCGVLTEGSGFGVQNQTWVWFQLCPLECVTVAYYWASVEIQFLPLQNGKTMIYLPHWIRKDNARNTLSPVAYSKHGVYGSNNTQIIVIIIHPLWTCRNKQLNYVWIFFFKHVFILLLGIKLFISMSFTNLVFDLKFSTAENSQPRISCL